MYCCLKEVLLKSFRVAFIASLVFYLISNGIVFIEGWYPRTLRGFVECYFMAIPFFWNKLSWICFCVDIIFRLFCGLVNESSSMHEVCKKLYIGKDASFRGFRHT
jgi:hypothetical protein